MGLCAIEPALAPYAARADGNHRLNDVIACAEWILSGVEQGEHAGFLIIVHAVAPKQRQSSGKADQGGENGFPRQPGKKDYK